MKTVDTAPRLLTAEGTLTARSRRGTVELRGVGETMEVRPDSLGACLDLLRTIPASRRSHVAGRVDAVLQRSGLSLDVRFGRLSIARLGSVSRPNLPARLAGWPSGQLTWAGLAATLVGDLVAQGAHHAA